MSNSTTSTGGVSFLGLLTIAFIVLKLADVIAWSWLWVLAPIWIPAVIFFGYLFVVVFLVVLAAVLNQR